MKGPTNGNEMLSRRSTSVKYAHIPWKIGDSFYQRWRHLDRPDARLISGG
jgi:hypothetical protein